MVHCRPITIYVFVFVPTEDCCPTHEDCHPNAVCEELQGPDSFTCVCPPPLMGDGMMTCMMGTSINPYNGFVTDAVTLAILAFLNSVL